jgi:hypothetical protein
MLKSKIMNYPSASSGRHGKVARLPAQIRLQLNRRLREKEPALSLLPWLNSLPEVQAILSEKFGSRPINKQNLSQWRRGGFRDWLDLQEHFESIYRSVTVTNPLFSLLCTALTCDQIQPNQGSVKVNPGQSK